MLLNSSIRLYLQTIFKTWNKIFKIKKGCYLPWQKPVDVFVYPFKFGQIPVQ